MVWETKTVPDPEHNVQHVYPTWGKHDTEGGECPCHPKREAVHNSGRLVGYVVIHREEN